ncbi:SLAM family member 9-like [Hyperolius riggenbachi]|uniref:SLAM family member 9-like n=1 Tax=Hyperolius riggenbachi TaxID=752182 RepID=UPI0035A3AD36
MLGQMKTFSLFLVLAFFKVSAKRFPEEEVFGLLNQSVSLSSHKSLVGPVEEVVWTFTSKGKTIKVAEIKNDKFRKFAKHFSDRIEMSSQGTVLVIKQLTPSDSGKYTSDITFTTKESHEPSFILSVYEPVFAPSIRTEHRIKTNDWCNVTLQCSVSMNSSALSYMWKYRHRDSDYQLYNTGDNMKMSLKPDTWDTEVLCIVHNPADQKNVTFYVQPLCIQGCSIYLRSALTALYVLMSSGCICMSRRYK